MGAFESQAGDPNNWIIEGRTYTLHTITLPASGCSEEATISCLLDPKLIPLLPNPPPFALKPIENCNFRILKTAHKGIGLFAARNIAAGELIIVEHPALILPSGNFPPERLPEKKRAELLAMANCRPPEECKSPVEGIVRTNGLMLELDPKGKIPAEQKGVYGGVYPLINRGNHSCGPNAGIKWDLAALTLSLYALRPILEGEEIHKTYLEPALPRETRVAHLQKNYRFECDCPWCNIRQSSTNDLQPSFTPDELEQIAESDRRRALLGTWIFTHPGYKKWSTDLARTDDLVISSHLEALELIEQEGMHGLQNLFIEEIAMCYSMLGDRDAFRAWGEKVVTLSRIEDPAAAKRFEEWLVDPEKKMKKWAWRKKQRQRELLSLFLLGQHPSIVYPLSQSNPERS
ncbi:hypothetical protein BDZ97DRAFT_1791564 [Flammula alnicola]|nr:hypothetical protein BDZ97DRAFT_1791564 [Flammula alnicola]